MHSSVEKVLGNVILLIFVVVNPPYRGRANRGGSEKKRRLSRCSIDAAQQRVVDVDLRLKKLDIF